jgi:hypothetical protein
MNQNHQQDGVQQMSFSQPAQTKPNIHQRIHAVMQEVDYIKRGSAGQGTGVKYDEVVAKLRPSMIKQGIIMTVSEVEQPKKIDEIVAKSGSKQSLYQGQLDVRLVNIDHPADFISYIVSAHGMDNGDKAPGKLNTYAAKVALVKAFSLETGENDESRNGPAEQPVSYATALQVNQFNQVLQRLGTDEATVMAYICNQVWKWTCPPVSFAELEESGATQVIQLMTMRLQQQAQKQQQAAQQSAINQQSTAQQPAQTTQQSPYNVAAYEQARVQAQSQIAPQDDEVPL